MIKRYIQSLAKEVVEKEVSHLEKKEESLFKEYIENKFEKDWRKYVCSIQKGDTVQVSGINMKVDKVEKTGVYMHWSTDINLTLSVGNQKGIKVTFNSDKVDSRLTSFKSVWKD